MRLFHDGVIQESAVSEPQAISQPKEQLELTAVSDSDNTAAISTSVDGLPSTPTSRSLLSILESRLTTDTPDASPSRNSSSYLLSSLTSTSTPTRTPPLRRALFPSLSCSPSSHSIFPSSRTSSPTRNPFYTPSSSLSSTTSTPTQTLFSTPERARIYSAFTFSSPSLAGRRYAVTKGSAVTGLSGFNVNGKAGNGPLERAFSEGDGGLFGSSPRPVFDLMSGEIIGDNSPGKLFDDLDW